MNIDFKERRRSKEELISQLIKAGGKPGRKNSFHCPFHQDRNPSSWIKLSTQGFYYWKCAVCNLHHDVWSLESLTTGKDFKTLVQEYCGKVEQQEYKKFYKTVEELVESIDAIEVEEVNLYTNPDDGNIDLLIIRYLPRDGGNKQFVQAYQSAKGFIRKRPQGLLPLFNRIRIKDADTVLYVEGEKSVRKLTELGFIATTGSGGSNNAAQHDYSTLSGKTVILWSDNDNPGRQYMSEVKAKLEALDPPIKVLEVDTSELELAEGDDVVDVCKKILEEGGNLEDCKDCISTLIDDAGEVNKLKALETLLVDMREGRYVNLPFSDCPIITNEARMMLNKRIGIIYGSAGFGKSLLIGKACDDLALAGHKVARLQLEDELEQHQLRSFAQQAYRAELANDDYHRQHPTESKLLYEQFKPTLEAIADTIFCGEHENWDDVKILKWVESKLEAGMDLVVVDPISVIMTDKIWITSHRLMWGTKKLLAKYPQGRIIYISHNNTEGEVAGGQATKRFSHAVLLLNRLKKPKLVEIATIDGESKIINIDASIGIIKSRYGRGGGLEVAVKLDSSTLAIQELGVILREIKDKEAKPSGRNLHELEDIDVNDL